MEAIILAGGKAERLGDVAGGLPKPLVPVAGRPLAAWQIGLLGRAGIERVSGGAGAARPRRRHPLRGKRAPGERRRPRAERGRAGRHRFPEPARDPPCQRRRGDDHRRAPEVAVRGRRARRRPGHGLRGRRDDRVLGQLRRLRPRRGGDRSFPGARRPRDDSVPRARRGREARRLPPRGTLADDQHPQGPATGRGVRRHAP